MSTEIIYINFDTIFWTSINKKQTSIYVTNLKSRIYKAAQSQMYSTMVYLQNRLMMSTAAKNLALFTLLEKKHFNNVPIGYLLKYLHSLDLLQSDHRKQLFTLSTNVLSNMQIDMFFEQIYHLLLLFIIEPQIKAKQDNCLYYFEMNSSNDILSFINNKLVNQSSQRYYLESICLIEYLSTCNLNYLFARLNMSKFLRNRVKQLFNTSTFLKYLKGLKDRVFKADEVNKQYPLYHKFVSIIMYCVCIEAIYLCQSQLHTRNQLLCSSSSFFVIILGAELLLVDNTYSNIIIKRQAFDFLIHYSTKKLIQNSFQFPFSLYQCINLLDYCICLKKDMRLFIRPSVDAQINLISQIHCIIKQEKGNSSANLIYALNKILGQWGKYFINTKSYKVFIFMDYLIYLKLRAWILRRHPSVGRNQIIKKYFLPLDTYNTVSRSRWIFYSKVSSQIITLLNLRYFT